MREHFTTEEAREEFRSFRAFRAWFRQATEGNVDTGAAILRDMAREGGDIAWLLLLATGDNAYTEETFRKAAGLALDTTEEK